MPVYAKEIKVAVQPVTFHQLAIPYTNVTPPAATDTSLYAHTVVAKTTV